MSSAGGRRCNTAGLVSTLLSLAAAGVMLVSTPVMTAAPHQDIRGTLFLVNRDYRVSANYFPVVTDTEVPGQVRKLRPEVGDALEAMFAACSEEAGVTLVSVSGYRSYGRQVAIYKRKLENVKGSRARADAYVARPGASEHQMGFSMDVGQRKSKTGLNSSFGSTKGGIWLRDNCWRFGFIIRYPEGSEEITGYSYEPWHVRYVGRPWSQQIHETGVPLETFLQDLRTRTLLRLLGNEPE